MITDADREAARSWNADHKGCCERQLAELLARHRLLGQREGMEMAAGVADEIAGLADKAKNIGLQAGAMASASRIRAIEVG